MHPHPIAPVTILIADDHPLMRRGLRDAIEAQTDFRIVGEASNGMEAIEEIRRLLPRLALLDLRMPEMNGIDVAKRVRDESLPVAVIILTNYDEDSLFRSAVEAGVMGYLLKECAVNEITSCIDVVARGDYYFSPALASRALARRGADERARNASLMDGLTQGERRILAMIAEYKSTPQIAAELSLSTRTIEHHRQNICGKLNLTGRYALTQFALEHREEIMERGTK